MTIQEIFKAQIDSGAKEMFFYGLETQPEVPGQWSISIERHRGTLDTFPDNLEFVRYLTPSNPLFRNKE